MGQFKNKGLSNLYMKVFESSLVPFLGISLLGYQPWILQNNSIFQKQSF